MSARTCEYTNWAGKRLMSTTRWYILLGLSLVIASIVVYALQIIAFDDARNTAFYLMQDLAFVPVQVLLVMLILDKLLQKKEKESLLKKLNMMIGVFFNEVGTGLISFFVETDTRIGEIRNIMLIGNEWSARSFNRSTALLKSHDPDISINPEILGRMKVYLSGHREEMLRMLENPNLLEHERFTDLLWAVFHLTDELHHRASFASLPDTDINHLKGDIARVFKLVMLEWVAYMKHLKFNYPYLFSLAVRTNPFDPDSAIEVE